MCDWLLLRIVRFSSLNKTHIAHPIQAWNKKPQNGKTTSNNNNKDLAESKQSNKQIKNEKQQTLKLWKTPDTIKRRQTVYKRTQEFCNDIFVFVCIHIIIYFILFLRYTMRMMTCIRSDIDSMVFAIHSIRISHFGKEWATVRGTRIKMVFFLA